MKSNAHAYFYFAPNALKWISSLRLLKLRRQSLQFLFALTFLGGLGRPVPALSATVSGWITDWDTEESLKTVREEITQIDTLWIFAANGAHLTRPAAKNAKNTGNAKNPWGLSEPLRALEALAQKKGVRIGPVIHNSSEQGFDADLGLKLIKDPKAIAERLKAELKLNHWRALNIDLELLPEKSQPQFEAFVRQLESTFRGTDVVITVCLHAQDGVTDIDISRFQNWKNLAQVQIQFVVMAYDHSWATSEPGPVAPHLWLGKILQNSRKVFGDERLVFALPVYGYHWKKNGKAWSGKSEDSSVLGKITKESGWVKDSKQVLEDGWFYSMKKGAIGEQAIAFDDDASVIAKLDFLAKSEGGGPQRVALWRLANAGTPLLKRIKR